MAGLQLTGEDSTLPRTQVAGTMATPSQIQIDGHRMTQSNARTTNTSTLVPGQTMYNTTPSLARSTDDMTHSSTESTLLQNQKIPSNTETPSLHAQSNAIPSTQTIPHTQPPSNSTPFHTQVTSSKVKSNTLAPPSTLQGLKLTPTQSRASQRSKLYPTRSYIDSHGTYSTSAEEEPNDTSSHSSKSGTQEKSSHKDVIFEGPDDPMNPKNLPTWRKWSIVIILALGSMCVTLTSSVYTTTYEQMNREFGNSTIVATLGLTLFVFGLGLAPMLLGPLSEFYGRRPIYIIGYTMFTIWLIPSAVARNIQTMLIARFFDGLGGSAFLSVAGGTVGDMFSKESLAAPMMIYSAAPFLGPGIGPVVGGFINYHVSWRWTYYVLLIWSGIMLVAISTLVPETYAPVVLRAKARKLRKETGDDTWKAKMEVTEKSIKSTVIHSLYRPFLMLFLDPMCFCLCLFSAILLGILYLFFGAFPLVFNEVYGFNIWQTGLAFLGITTGMLIAISSDPIWHYLYIWQLDRREQKTGERISEPEYRLPCSIVGAWFVVIGLFWFGWTIYPSVHWMIPVVGTSFFGCGIILTYFGIFTFLVEAFPLYAASALSANSFARSSFAGAFPLFGRQMYRTLNFHWATTLLACLTLVMAPAPYVFYLHGKKLRGKSRFSPPQD